MVSEIYLLYWICRLNVRLFKLLKKLLTFIIVLLQTFRGGCYWSICKFIVGDKMYDIYKAKPREFFLACRRILDWWKLLVYVRTVVVAIFDFMTGRLGRVEIATLTRPFFLLSFGVSTWHLCAPEENTCTAGYAIIVFLLLLLCTFHTNPKETLNDKIKYVYIMTDPD